ncbi:MAG TPA: hypothetical protein VFK96_04425 [Gammaproteobacteria bacterium]|nr:hypothetical protein [Gammaproteobacteria bacterium]
MSSSLAASGLRSRRRLIGGVAAATFLLWVISCSGAVVDIGGPMHAAGHAAAAHSHRPGQQHKPDQCCNQLAKLAGATAAIVKVAHAPLQLIAMMSPSMAIAEPVHNLVVSSWRNPRAPPPRKPALIAHLSWPNAPPV